jgi:hypothetical protein
MAYFLITGRYTTQAFKGMAENCEDRTEALAKGLAAFGGGIIASSWRSAASSLS